MSRKRLRTRKRWANAVQEENDEFRDKQLQDWKDSVADMDRIRLENKAIARLRHNQK